MEETNLLAPLLLTIAGLMVGAIFKSLFQRTRIPYTVGLFAIGLIAGILNRAGVFQNTSQLSQALDSVANINPDLILYIFLPILIFDAAYELNLHIFKKNVGKRHFVGCSRPDHLHVTDSRPINGTKSICSRI